jgi:hypothetical protein
LLPGTSQMWQHATNGRVAARGAEGVSVARDQLNELGGTGRDLGNELGGTGGPHRG